MNPLYLNHTYSINVERDKFNVDRWCATISGIPTSKSYAETLEDAMLAAEAIALRILAFKIEKQLYQNKFQEGFYDI